MQSFSKRLMAKKVLAILGILLVAYTVWDIAQVSAFEGKYKSIEGSYDLTLSKTGRVEAKDAKDAVVLNGIVYSVPDSDNPYRIHAKTNFALRSIWLTEICRGEKMIPCRVVSLETDTGPMQFDEIP